ncbi:hypothetical protein LSA88_002842 [Listeria monocytogenes]|nr:hypothetical protein [Listeria monocytogenes]EIP2458397.1 hypothetical protein [Listeria monocytogenes]EIP2514754.1 hypothetical protein [Listeria monocytogenes]EIR6790396.1 hypothetical protein [Listeria monocytogenes]EIR6803647.1 hypothetical protein [Listeria monocytogenes]
MGSKEKTREIVSYIFNNPNKSVAELAKHFDTTRKGIHLIIQKNSELKNQRLEIIKLAGRSPVPYGLLTSQSTA